MAKRIEEKVIDSIVDLYINKNLTRKEISETLNITKDTISKYLNKKGIKVINPQNYLRVRENLFDKISTEEDAYWLGFILSDGYIDEKGSFELSLKSSDYIHLEKFSKYIGYKGKLVRSQKVKCKGITHYRCRLQFSVQHLKSNFTKIGIVPNKGDKIVFPKIRKFLIKHFLRGYTDGDGSFNIYDIKYKYNILGTKEFLNSILNYFLEEKLIILKKDTLSITKKNDSEYCKSLTLSGTKQGKINIMNILNHLYKDSSIFLDRKYETYLKLCRVS